MKQRKPLNLLVPKAGLEPARPLRRGILNCINHIKFQLVSRKSSHERNKNIHRLCELIKMTKKESE